MTEADGAGDEVTIGEFARLSRLAPKALRLYDQTGLLEPARVDPATGARRYRLDQLGRARLVAALRQAGIPLGEIGPALAEDGSVGARRIAAYWAEAEAEHAARRRLVSSLIDRMRGNPGSTSTAYAVGLRTLPDRSVLTQTRHVHVDGLTIAREEFVGAFRQAGVPQLGGVLGAPFTVHYGEVSLDSDGPIEWCWPVREQEAEQLAARFPDLTLRTDPAHQEAYVHYGATTQLHAARISLAAQSLLTWARDQDRRSSGGTRLVYLSPGNGSEHDCDVALPLARQGERPDSGLQPSRHGALR